MIAVLVIVACLVLAALASCFRMASLTDRADEAEADPELSWTAADDEVWRILASRPFEK